LENRLNTEGNATSVNIGAITNLQMVRLGVAYNSPRWYRMTDYYGAWAGTLINEFNEPEMENETPNDSYSEYRFRTPGKWIFSGAVILGRSALISAEYEIMNYKEMLFSERHSNAGFDTNDYIREDYTWSHTAKLGAEIKITPQFAIRGGAMLQSTPMQKALIDNDVEVLPAGTIPHFTVQPCITSYYTAGLGYRFTPNFYMDLACIFRHNQSDAYAFSNTFSNDGRIDIQSTPAKLTTNTTRFALTLGYKF
jgi:long-subunit fatty acid transport protein